MDLGDRAAAAPPAASSPPDCPAGAGAGSEAAGRLSLGDIDRPVLGVATTDGGRSSPDDRPRPPALLCLSDLPNELLLHILGFLDVCDLLATSRTSQLLRTLSLSPFLHLLRLRRARLLLPPLLHGPSRPTLADLASRSIFLTHTTVVSRKLARALVSIRLSRRLASRPTPQTLVERCVLPPECVPSGRASTAHEPWSWPATASSSSSPHQYCDGVVPVAPALVAKKRAVERERVKDGLRRWVGAVLRKRVRERAEGVRRWEETAGVGRVWKLRRFWERVGRGEAVAPR